MAKQSKILIGMITESFQVSDEEVVLFTEQHMDGYVGEDMVSYMANLVNLESNTVEQMNLGMLKSFYPEVEGRRDRIAYWRWMGEFTVEGQQRRAENERADVESRIR